MSSKAKCRATLYAGLVARACTYNAVEGEYCGHHGRLGYEVVEKRRREVWLRHVRRHNLKSAPECRIDPQALTTRLEVSRIAAEKKVRLARMRDRRVSIRSEVKAELRAQIAAKKVAKSKRATRAAELAALGNSATDEMNEHRLRRKQDLRARKLEKEAGAPLDPLDSPKNPEPA